jgi:hypothetical protein
LRKICKAVIVTVYDPPIEMNTSSPGTGTALVLQSDGVAQVPLAAFSQLTAVMPVLQVIRQRLSSAAQMMNLHPIFWFSWNKRYHPNANLLLRTIFIKVNQKAADFETANLFSSNGRSKGFFTLGEPAAGPIRIYPHLLGMRDCRCNCHFGWRLVCRVGRQSTQRARRPQTDAAASPFGAVDHSTTSVGLRATGRDKL